VLGYDCRVLVHVAVLVVAVIRSTLSRRVVHVVDAHVTVSGQTIKRANLMTAVAVQVVVVVKATPLPQQYRSLFNGALTF